MKNKTKALLIPIAAFAVTVTGANAFNSDVLEKAGLDDNQISAFEEARELRKDGDKKAARDVLIEAGVDIETMHVVRDAMRHQRELRHEAVEDAVHNGDYDAFLEAVAGSPVAEIVDTPEEFALFTEAFDLREAGDKEAARGIMEDLGFERGIHGTGHHGRRMHHGDDEHGERGDRGGMGARFSGFHGELDSE